MANKFTKAYWYTRRPDPNEKGELFCNACAQWLTPESYKKVARLKYGLDHYCRACRRKRAAEIQHRLHGVTPVEIYNAARHVPPGFCKTCKQVKPVSEFTKVSSGKRGHAYSCRDCETKRHQSYKLIPGYIERRRANAKKTREKTRHLPEKIKRNAVRRITIEAVKAGFITKLPCERCGEKKVEAHHHDYNKPFDVVWLCRIHHVEHHRIEGRH